MYIYIYLCITQHSIPIIKGPTVKLTSSWLDTGFIGLFRVVWVFGGLCRLCVLNLVKEFYKRFGSSGVQFLWFGLLAFGVQTSVHNTVSIHPYKTHKTPSFVSFGFQK